MRYSVEPRGRTYVKCYEFLSFAKNIGKYATKFAKNMDNKYSQKHLDSAKKSTTVYLAGNKIPDRVTSLSKK